MEVITLRLTVAAHQLHQHQSDIETILFGGGDQIPKDMGYEICIASTGSSNFIIIAQEIKSSEACQLTLSRNGNFTRGDDC